MLGIGAGWNEAEYLSYGWPFPTARERIAQLAEAIRICRLMWTEAPANFEGQHYQIKDAYCEPRTRSDTAGDGWWLRREIHPACGG